MSLESARKIVSANEEKNGRIASDGKNSQPARILYISNFEGKGKKNYSKGLTPTKLSKEQVHSGSAVRNKDFSSFRAMFDDHDEYKIPLKMDNKRNGSLGKSELINSGSSMKKSMALEVNLAKENMDLKERLFELAEMNLRLLNENQELRSRLSKYENLNNLQDPKPLLKPYRESINNEGKRPLEDKLSTSMCIHTDLNNSFRSKNYKTMKTLDEKRPNTLEGDREYILAQLNEFSKQNISKKFDPRKPSEQSKITNNTLEKHQIVKRDDIKHLSAVIGNNAQIEKPTNNAVLFRGRSQENNNMGMTAVTNSNNLNSSFDSKKMHDNMILNNVNEPSAIPMNGSQNFFSRPGSQNNIIIQDEYQYIPGMESKNPSRNGSRQGSRLEAAQPGNINRGRFIWIFY